MLGERAPSDKLIAIFRERDERAESRHLGTRGSSARSSGGCAIRQFSALSGSSPLSIMRGVASTARRFGLIGAMPAGYAMPCEYDVLSRQP
jgi:hypothetical protein